MENLQKVQQKVDELNKRDQRSGLPMVPGILGQKSTPQWVAIEGYFALTGFSNKSGQSVFNSAFGVPVKVFLNNKTGAIEIFSSNLFEN